MRPTVAVCLIATATSRHVLAMAVKRLRARTSAAERMPGAVISPSRGAARSKATLASKAAARNRATLASRAPAARRLRKPRPARRAAKAPSRRRTAHRVPRVRKPAERLGKARRRADTPRAAALAQAIALPRQQAVADSIQRRGRPGAVHVMHKVRVVVGG